MKCCSVFGYRIGQFFYCFCFCFFIVSLIPCTFDGPIGVCRALRAHVRCLCLIHISVFVCFVFWHYIKIKVHVLPNDTLSPLKGLVY